MEAEWPTTEKFLEAFLNNLRDRGVYFCATNPSFDEDSRAGYHTCQFEELAFEEFFM